MINRYMNTIGNKKLELFDNGAGASVSTAEENVQLASGKVFIVILIEIDFTLYLCFFCNQSSI